MLTYSMSKGSHMSNLFSNDLENKIALQIPQVVQASGISKSTIYLMLKNGELPSRKVRGRRLVLKRDLEAFLENAPSTYLS